MELLIASLAVYKIVQIINLLLPKEPMPWVKVVASTIISYAVVLVFQMNDIWISGLAVATVAGGIHSALRLATFSGDMAHRKSLR